MAASRAWARAEQPAGLAQSWSSRRTGADGGDGAERARDGVRRPLLAGRAQVLLRELTGVLVPADPDQAEGGAGAPRQLDGVGVVAGVLAGEQEVGGGLLVATGGGGELAEARSRPGRCRRR